MARAAGGVMLALAAWASVAVADVESADVKRAVAALDHLEYERAVHLLTRALAAETLTHDERVAAYRTLGFAHVGLEEGGAAVADFEALLRIEPGYELDRTISPRVRALFEQARTHVATGESGRARGKPGLPLLAPTVTPELARAGVSVEISAGWDGVAQRVELFYRTAGQPLFSKLTTPLDAAGHFSLVIPGMQVRAPALEYYAVVLDRRGAPVAEAGTLGQPLVIDVTSGKPTPVYARPWFWGVLGGASAAIIVVGIAVGVSVSHGSTTTPPPRGRMAAMADGPMLP